MAEKKVYKQTSRQTDIHFRIYNSRDIRYIHLSVSGLYVCVYDLSLAIFPERSVSLVSDWISVLHCSDVLPGDLSDTAREVNPQIQTQRPGA